MPTDYKLACAAEYVVDGDQVLVNIYMLDGTKRTTRNVQAGTVELFSGTTVWHRASFDAYFGNSDGSFKFVFNHPRSTNAQVRVSITTHGGDVLNDIFGIDVIAMPDPVVGGNSSGVF